MNDKSTTTFQINENDKWFKFNVLWKGLYRVNYDEGNWQALISALISDINVNVLI